MNPSNVLAAGGSHTASGAPEQTEVEEFDAEATEEVADGGESVPGDSKSVENAPAEAKSAEKSVKSGKSAGSRQPTEGKSVEN